MVVLTVVLSIRGQSNGSAPESDEGGAHARLEISGPDKVSISRVMGWGNIWRRKKISQEISCGRYLHPEEKNILPGISSQGEIKIRGMGWAVLD